MKKILSILLLSAFTELLNAQVIYYAHAYKVPGTMKYETVEGDVFSGEKNTFELEGTVLIQKDADADITHYYLYNKEASAVMEYPSYLRKTSSGDYILMVIGKESEIIEISEFNPDDPSESVIDKWVTVHRPSSENSTPIIPPSNNYGGNTYGENSYGGNTYNGSSSNSDGGMLESQYRQWENRARSNYNSLTNLGSQHKRSGKYVGGSTGQSMSSSNYTQMKRSLREAQQEMRSIRQKASAKGIRISKSQYEDIVVNY